MDPDAFPLFQWMGDVAPCFPVKGDQIQIIRQPTEFYETIKVLSTKSKSRIVITSYYFGTEKFEKELIGCIHEAVKRAEKERGGLRVRFLFDFLRGSRGERNSRTLLLPMLRDFGQRVSAAVYHSPDVRGMAKLLLPRKYQETIGVFHMKTYLFDNTIVMTGANLSEPYFIDRQDRYFVINGCVELCDLFQTIVYALSSMSFQLQPDGHTHLPTDRTTCHPFLEADDGTIYKKEMKQIIEQVISNASNDRPLSRSKVTDHGSSGIKGQRSDACAEVDTLIYPLFQMAPFGIRDEEIVMKALLGETLPPDDTVHLVSPYFNPTDECVSSMLNGTRGRFEILTCSPQVNCFFGLPGLMGSIPNVYSSILKRFIDDVSRSEQGHRISVYEYERPGWTMHAKGLWYYVADQSLPVMTIVGSSNFGYRSVCRDLEAEVVIVTQNEILQTQLHKEQLKLYSRSCQATSETFLEPQRTIPRWITSITPIIKTFM